MSMHADTGDLSKRTLPERDSLINGMTTHRGAPSRDSPACWASIADAERHLHTKSGVVRAAVRRGEIPAYRRPGRRGAAIVDLLDVDEWVRGTWEPVCGDGLG